MLWLPMLALLAMTLLGGTAAAQTRPPEPVTAPVTAPVTLRVGPAHAGAIVYGPADMFCDLEKCRMFKVPGLPPKAEVDFPMPNLKGEERADLRRCFSFCRAAVLGYVTAEAVPPADPLNPSFTIAPIELRLQ